MLAILIIFFLLLNVAEKNAALLKYDKIQSSASLQKTETFGCPTFSPVQKLPHFPGGIRGWKKYLETNLQYPQAAINHDKQAIILVQLTVQINGNVTDVQALNDPGYGLGYEAVSVIKASPSWRPAIKNGKPAVYRFIQTITFQLQ